MAQAKRKSLTKTELLKKIADETGLTKQQVALVFNGLTTQISKSLEKDGPGEMTLPGLLKIFRQEKPAVPAAKGITNPFKPGETYNRKPNPATNVVKVKLLKGLKEMV